MRAIYIGKQHFRPFGLCYGMTGTIKAGFHKNNEFQFKIDGNPTTTYLLPRELLYVPASDMTRHCPKP